MDSYASPWRSTLFKVRFPASVPYLIPALKVAATAAVVGAIVGEISAGVRGGLGRLIIDYSQQYLQDPARLYCVVIFAGIVGICFVALIAGARPLPHAQPAPGAPVTAITIAGIGMVFNAAGRTRCARSRPSTWTSKRASSCR